MKFPFLFLLFLAVSARADELGGPLPIQNQRPYNSAFLTLEPQSPNVLAPGKSRLNMQLDIANNLLIPNPDGAVVEEDFETQRFALRFSRGLKNDFEAQIGLQLKARGGGFSDAIISAYHDLTGIGSSADDNPLGRDSRPKNRSVLFSSSGVNEGSALGLGDATLALKKQISEGRFSSAARLALKIPLGSENKILGSGGFEVGAGLDARYELRRRWAVFGNFAVQKFGDSDIPGAKNRGWNGGLGIEYASNSRDSILAQLDAQSASVRTGNAFADQAPALFSLGYKRRVNANRTFWASFSENGDWTNYKTAALGQIGPDFSISVGYDWGF